MSFSPMAKGLPIAEVNARQRLVSEKASVREGALMAPFATLRTDLLEENLALMERWCADHDVMLAPHGKTTMAPELVKRHLAHGAWGVTVADAFQAAVFVGAGIPRILIANEVVDPLALKWLVKTVADTQIIVYVDSLVGAGLLEQESKGTANVDVLIELGYPGGRTGVREVEDALELAEAVANMPGLHLRGAAGFEGLMAFDRGEEEKLKVVAYLGDLAELGHELCARQLVAQEEAILSAGGSAYFDLVVSAFAPVRRSFEDVTIVLRSGCYLTHDHGRYKSTSPSRSWELGEFKPAMEIWGRVLSRPERDLAIIGIGRRDVSFDMGLPLPLRRVGPEGDVDLGTSYVRGLNDQHAHLVLEEGVELGVGDLVVFGISHPCTTFDKWRSLALVDREYHIVEFVDTFF